MQEIQFVYWVSTTLQNVWTTNSVQWFRHIIGLYPWQQSHALQTFHPHLTKSKTMYFALWSSNGQKGNRMWDIPVCGWELKQGYFALNFVLNKPMWRVLLNHACHNSTDVCINYGKWLWDCFRIKPVYTPARYYNLIKKKTTYLYIK